MSRSVAPGWYVSPLRGSLPSNVGAAPCGCPRDAAGKTYADTGSKRRPAGRPYKIETSEVFNVLETSEVSNHVPERCSGLVCFAPPGLPSLQCRSSPPWLPS